MGLAQRTASLAEAREEYKAQLSCPQPDRYCQPAEVELAAMMTRVVHLGQEGPQ